ncbi:MAG: chitin disaccharide deacetylase [Bacillota bacterium]|uniref:Chitin disaccharide deacetylase n=1 Tax=Virgibacillus salarius TaxID=447199 RepID=A0A941DV78_9BACI|nr:MULTISPECIES: chitin disaccharide deacetylase [Virgibacillus]NAZ10000.1 chitin disaccharide deacetylase [Agaribacter marinus]MBR7797290.1 chitin disaccharide deacetylase [Virgibacillus salarius]MCC2250600.1 chitin disaccharide deacetylase [Virgibacillus sp. AGTR]MDY7046294.1 chitin disaccharide deacetylase [Virgibacillus sp. M23]QRZ18483.1 chitin disaccharide deacetylase [Virgibacillus sp. AGTR]
MKVLFNADDYGLTKGVTDGIIQSHLQGVVDSTTLMMNGLAVDYAVEQAKAHPTLKVGIHLVLTWGKPLSSKISDLVNEDGTFRFSSRFRQMNPPNLQELELEWRSQIEAFLNTGLPLHHIDSHHHVHGWEPLKPLIMKLAKDYQVPVRVTDSLKDEKDILLTEQIWLDFYGEGITPDLFSQIQSLEASSIEIMTHPAMVDNDLLNISSYLDKRQEELKILCSLQAPDWVEKIE